MGTKTKTKAMTMAKTKDKEIFIRGTPEFETLPNYHFSPVSVAFNGYKNRDIYKTKYKGKTKSMTMTN